MSWMYFVTGNTSKAFIYFVHVARQAVGCWGRTQITAKSSRAERSVLHLLLWTLICFSYVTFFPQKLNWFPHKSENRKYSSLCSKEKHCSFSLFSHENSSRLTPRSRRETSLPLPSPIREGCAHWWGRCKCKKLFQAERHFPKIVNVCVLSTSWAIAEYRRSVMQAVSSVLIWFPPSALNKSYFY